MDELDVQVVLALADNRMNVSEAARVLYMHRNGVSYRIKKIRRITGLDPLNFYDLYKLVEMVGDCVFCREEICVNTDCTLCGGSCPVPGKPGICRFEDRSRKTQ